MIILAFTLILPFIVYPLVCGDRDWETGDELIIHHFMNGNEKGYILAWREARAMLRRDDITIYRNGVEV